MKRGRPRGLTINAEAVEGFLDLRCISKTELCNAAGLSPGHFADMLAGRKGASPARVRALANELHCRPGAIAPELTARFLSVRPGDDMPDDGQAA